MMKLWIDDVRPAPQGYMWIITTKEAIKTILAFRNDIEEISLDHDAGEYVAYGGDYIKILDKMEEKGINNISIHLHTANPVGRENMRRIIKKMNGKRYFINEKIIFNDGNKWFREVYLGT